MFGDLLGNVEEQQKALKEKLSSIEMVESIEDGAIKIVFNAAKEVSNISIDKEKIDVQDTDKMEDLLTILVNKAMTIAMEKEREESQKMMENLMPGGLGGLANIFGK